MSANRQTSQQQPGQQKNQPDVRSVQNPTAKKQPGSQQASNPRDNESGNSWNMKKENKKDGSQSC